MLAWTADVVDGALPQPHRRGRQYRKPSTNAPKRRRSSAIWRSVEVLKSTTSEFQGWFIWAHVRACQAAGWWEPLEWVSSELRQSSDCSLTWLSLSPGAHRWDPRSWTTPCKGHTAAAARHSKITRDVWNTLTANAYDLRIEFHEIINLHYGVFDFGAWPSALLLYCLIISW